MQQYATTKQGAEAVTPRVKNGQPSRRSALGGMLTAVLLLPVPAFAFTWVSSSWTAVGTPVNVANDSTGFGEVTMMPDSLFIQPTATSTATSITLTRDFLPGSTPPKSKHVGQRSAQQLFSQLGDEPANCHLDHHRVDERS